MKLMQFEVPITRACRNLELLRNGSLTSSLRAGGEKGDVGGEKGNVGSKGAFLRMSSRDQGPPARLRDVGAKGANHSDAPNAAIESPLSPQRPAISQF